MILVHFLSEMQNFEQIRVKKQIIFLKNFFQCAQKKLHFISTKIPNIEYYFVSEYFDKKIFFVL